jgi:hypothetical protein
MGNQEGSMELDSKDKEMAEQSNTADEAGMTKMEGLLQAIAEQNPIPCKKAGTGNAPVLLDSTPPTKKRRALPKAAVALNDTAIVVDTPPIQKKAPTSTTVKNPIMLVDSPDNKALKPPSCDNLANVGTDAVVLLPHANDAAIIMPVSLAAFYAFIGANEFIRQDGDHHNVKHALKVGFADNPKTIGYDEIDLFHCCNWYKELRCADIIDNPTDGDVMWNYRLVITNPSAPDRNYKKHEKYLPRVAKFKALVAKFCANGFTAGEPTMSCINMAFDHDITIMIVAKKTKTPWTEWKPMWEEKNVGLRIIGAVTFSRTTQSCKRLIYRGC